MFFSNEASLSKYLFKQLLSRKQHIQLCVKTTIEMLSFSVVFKLIIYNNPFPFTDSARNKNKVWMGDDVTDLSWGS